MTADVFRDAKKAPFVPFDIILADRTTYTVTGPDFIAIAPFPRAREVILYSADEAAPDGYRTRTINLGLIAEVVSPSVVAAKKGGPAAGGNGD
jgi:hypothetical protein